MLFYLNFMPNGMYSVRMQLCKLPLVVVSYQLQEAIKFDH